MDLSKAINIPLKENGYLLDNIHCNVSGVIHSSKYYYIKKFFQQSNNCHLVSNELKVKLQKLNILEDFTIIGYRNYLSFTLNYLSNQFTNCNYGIVNDTEHGFEWDELPELKSKIILVFPISITFSTMFKLKKWVENSLLKTGNTIGVLQDVFFSVFTLIDKEFFNKNVLDFGALESIESKMYSKFGWKSKNNDTIFLETKISIVTLQYLEANLYLPYLCEKCFPDEIVKEEPIIHTNKDIETPQVKFETVKYHNTSYNDTILRKLISHDSQEDVIYSGNVQTSTDSYNDFIKGSAFYKTNRQQIIEHFVSYFQNIDFSQIQSIYIVTSENYYCSQALEDLFHSSIFEHKSIEILKFKSNSDYLLNFDFVYNSDLLSANTLLLYFEDVLSKGRTFSIISEKLFHLGALNDIDVKFDLVFSLVDRSSLNTHLLIKSKLRSRPLLVLKNQIVSFLKLNVPTLSELDFGNPISLQVDELETIRENSSLDFLKNKIEKKIPDLQPKRMTNINLEEKKPLDFDKFFPFSNLLNDKDLPIFYLYKNHFDEKYQNVVRIYLVHLLNSKLSDAKDKINIEVIVNSIIKEEVDNIYSLMIDETYSLTEQRNKEVEEMVLYHSLISILCKPPYSYYLSVKNQVFSLVQINLIIFIEKIESGKFNSFNDFMYFKFWIEKSKDVDSNIVLSPTFFNTLRKYLSTFNLSEIFEKLKINYKRFGRNPRLKDDVKEILTKQQKFKIKMLDSFLPELHIIYKELLNGKLYRSIMLEKLINEQSYLPEILTGKSVYGSDIIPLYQSLYFHFTWQLKLENVTILDVIIKNNVKFLSKSDDLNNILNINWNHRLFRKRNNPIITSLQSFIKLSRYENVKRKYYKYGVGEIRRSLKETIHTYNYLKKYENVSDSLKFKDRMESVLIHLKKMLVPYTAPWEPSFGVVIQYKDVEREANKDNTYILGLETKPQSKTKVEHKLKPNRDPNSNEYDSNEYISLNKKGFVLRFVSGIKDKNYDASIQSFVTLTNDSKHVFSLSENYYCPISKENLNIQESYYLDCLNNSTKEGFDFFKRPSTTLLFRLNDSFARDENDSIKGCFYFNFKHVHGDSHELIEFISNEKIRLLFIIRKELSIYMQKQFKNDAFFDIINGLIEKKIAGDMRHGFGSNFRSLKQIVNDMLKGNLEISNKILFDSVFNTITGQINVDFTRSKADFETRYIDKNEFLEVLAILFESGKIGGKFIPFASIELINFNFETLKIREIIYDVVIYEILTNIKKYCPYINHEISIEYTENYLIFKNKIEPSLTKDSAKKGFGLKMIREILNIFDCEISIIPEDHIEDQIFTLNVKLI